MTPLDICRLSDPAEGALPEDIAMTALMKQACLLFSTTRCVRRSGSLLLLISEEVGVWYTPLANFYFCGIRKRHLILIYALSSDGGVFRGRPCVRGTPVTTCSSLTHLGGALCFFYGCGRA